MKKKREDKSQEKPTVSGTIDNKQKLSNSKQCLQSQK